MAREPSKIETVYRFFSGTGSSYDRVAALCTCGLDKVWKKRIVSAIPGRPAKIMDQACGTGILTLRLARKFPDCQITGVELRDEYLDLARNRAKTLRLKNVDFILGRAEDVMPDGSYDCITSSYLAKYADLETLLANASKMLRPGGMIIMHDFTYPSNPLFLPAWQAYFRLLQTVGSRIYPEWRTVFEELPEFLRRTDWVSESVAILRKNAFCGIMAESLTLGAAALVTARRSGASSD